MRRSWWCAVVSVVVVLGLASCSPPLADEGLAVEVLSPVDFEVTVRVVGPEGFDVELRSGAELNDLVPGEYHIEAEQVGVDGTLYDPQPSVQVVRLGKGNGRKKKVTIVYEPAPTAPAPPPSDPVAADGDTYYLHCTAGDDRASGRSESQAWRTLDRLWSAALAPGDRLLLARGCEWVGPMTIRWSGTASRPILVGAYGSGSRPAIRDSNDNHVVITGSHLVVEHLRAFTSPGRLPVDPGCQGQPYGWRTGFTVADEASHVTIRSSQAYGNTIGVHVKDGARHVTITGNELFANAAMAKNTPGGNDDYGAWGVLVNGSDTVVAHNRFWDNHAWCSYDYGQDGAAIEVYAAQRTLIHHNVSVNDAAFVEVGSSPQRAAQDTVLAYNTYTSARPVAEFLMVHAGLTYGPTVRTHAFHNTVYLPRPERTQGVTCYGGPCGADVISFRNNIFVVGWRAVYLSGAGVESHNVYWRPGGSPFMEFLGGARMSASSQTADPLFVDAAGGDFRLRVGSPAIDAGADLGLGFSSDASGQPLPVGPSDVGAHEHGGATRAGR